MLKKKISKRRNYFRKRKVPRFPFYYYGLGKNNPSTQVRTFERKVFLDSISTISAFATSGTIAINPLSFNTHEIITGIDDYYELYCIKYIKVTFSAFTNKIQDNSVGTVKDVIMWTETDSATSATTNERRLALGQRFYWPFQKCQRGVNCQLLAQQTNIETKWLKVSENLGTSPSIFLYVETSGAVQENTDVGRWHAEGIISFKSSKY